MEDIILKMESQVDSWKLEEEHYKKEGDYNKVDICRQSYGWINYWAKLLRAQLELENE